jgi:hypothetical protein
MANSTDLFGKNVFGGATSIPGGTTSTTTAAKTNPYKYAGQGWNDPLAQQIYKEFAPVGGNAANQVSLLLRGNEAYAPGGIGAGVNYNNPLDPKTWGGSERGDVYDRMKAEYLKRGGQGTYEQQAQYPGATNWPMDASGNPLPRMNMQTGKAESIVPGAPPPGVGSGSSMSLSPDVLKKMWR